MKLMTDHRMNQENNETKIMLTREQAMRRKAKDTHGNYREDKDIVDCD